MKMTDDDNGIVAHSTTGTIHKMMASDRLGYTTVKCHAVVKAAFSDAVTISSRVRDRINLISHLADTKFAVY